MATVYKTDNKRNQGHYIKIYKFPETDDEKESKTVKYNLPLTVVGSNTIIKANVKRVRGRLGV